MLPLSFNVFTFYPKALGLLHERQFNTVAWISISVRSDNCSPNFVEGRNFFGRKAIAFLDDANDELILSSDD
jgi:hypothetical protein